MRTKVEAHEMIKVGNSSFDRLYLKGKDFATLKKQFPNKREDVIKALSAKLEAEYKAEQEAKAEAKAKVDADKQAKKDAKEIEKNSKSTDSKDEVK